MAEPVFIVRDSAWNVRFDSRSAVAAVLVFFERVPAGSNRTLTFPDFVGRSAVVTNGIGGNSWSVTTDTALGYPRVQIIGDSERLIAVWVV